MDATIASELKSSPFRVDELLAKVAEQEKQVCRLAAEIERLQILTHPGPTTNPPCPYCREPLRSIRRVELDGRSAVEWRCKTHGTARFDNPPPSS